MKDKRKLFLKKLWLNSKRHLFKAFKILVKLLGKTITITIILGPAMYFGVQKRPTEMGLAIAASCIAIAFINIDKFSKFKAAGFEAELRETLEKTNVTLEQMRKIIKPLTSVTLEVATHGNRFSFQNQSESMFSNILDVIDSVGIRNDPEIAERVENFHRYRTWDLYGDFADSIRQNDNKLEALDKELYELKDYYSTEYPTLEKINQIILGHISIEQLSDETKDKLKIYSTYKDKHNS